MTKSEQNPRKLTKRDKINIAVSKGRRKNIKVTLAPVGQQK